MDIEEADLKGNRIRKKKKADLETLEAISEDELVIFGSGSKSPHRDVLIRVLLGDEPQIQKYYITDFYNHLKSLPILEKTELNIEATAFSNGFLYLFNRTNNVIIRFNYQDFIAYLSNKNIPKIETNQVTLPKIKGFEAGFSGAVAQNSSSIFFTASVEATDDSYNDGEIIGSLVGELNVSDFQNSTVTQFEVIPDNNKALKVESVTISNCKSTRNKELVLITDDDKGNTEIIKISVK